MSSDSYENNKTSEFSCNQTLDPMKITEENEDEEGINTESNLASHRERYEAQIHPQNKSNPLHNI